MLHRVLPCHLNYPHTTVGLPASSATHPAPIIQACKSISLFALVRSGHSVLLGKEYCCFAFSRHLLPLPNGTDRVGTVRALLHFENSSQPTRNEQNIGGHHVPFQPFPKMLFEGTYRHTPSKSGGIHRQGTLYPSDINILCRFPAIGAQHGDLLRGVSRFCETQHQHRHTHPSSRGGASTSSAVSSIQRRKPRPTACRTAHASFRGLNLGLLLAVLRTLPSAGLTLGLTHYTRVFFYQPSSVTIHQSVQPRVSRHGLNLSGPQTRSADNPLRFQVLVPKTGLQSYKGRVTNYRSTR